MLGLFPDGRPDALPRSAPDSRLLRSSDRGAVRGQAAVTVHRDAVASVVDGGLMSKQVNRHLDRSRRVRPGQWLPLRFRLHTTHIASTTLSVPRSDPSGAIADAHRPGLAGRL